MHRQIAGIYGSETILRHGDHCIITQCQAYRVWKPHKLQTLGCSYLLCGTEVTMCHQLGSLIVAIVTLMREDYNMKLCSQVESGSKWDPLNLELF